MRSVKRLSQAGLLALVWLSTSLHAGLQPPQAAVASAHPLATQAGENILQAGGNAFDAAVAVAAMLAVAEPSGSGLGGGGFFLLHSAEDGRKHFLDARETAPAAIRAAMYLDEEGRPQRELLRRGPLAAGIPGLPAGLVQLAQEFGSMPLKQLLEPAIRVAQEGFEIDAKLARTMAYREADLASYAHSAAVFLDEQGEALAAGTTLKQPDLARTLQKLATFGRAGFYSGSVADEMLRSVRNAGGVWTAEDLRNYAVKMRRPLVLGFGDWQIVTAPPPSSGGLVLGEIFQMLDLMGFTTVEDMGLRRHMLIEAMRRAYFDRARYMGDADYVPVPSRRLLAREHAQQWLESYSPRHATPSAELSPEPIASVGMGMNTTHFSILDGQGNRVSATLSINFGLGAAFVAGRSGVLLNNEMDDFVIAPGVPNGYGLVGGEANLVEPGKRMLSSMTPTFLEGAERVAILGTPGGSRIITMVLLGLLDLMEGRSAAEVVAAPRFHHQYLPDVVQLEQGGFDDEAKELLQLRGHPIKELSRQYGNMQVVVWDQDKAKVDAAADPRGVGRASSFVVRPSIEQQALELIP